MPDPCGELLTWTTSERDGGARRAVAPAADQRARRYVGGRGQRVGVVERRQHEQAGVWPSTAVKLCPVAPVTARSVTVAEPVSVTVEPPTSVTMTVVV